MRGWNPLTLFAQHVKGLYDASDPTSVADIGTTWLDRCQAGRHLTKVGAGTPTLIASDPHFNGRPSVQLNGDCYFDTTTYASEPQPRTIIIVSDGVDLSDGMFMFHGQTDNQSLFTSGTLWLSSTTQTDFGWGSTICGVSSGGISAFEQRVYPRLIECEFNGALSTLTIDGDLKATHNCGSAGSASFRLGARWTGSSNYKGRFAYVLIIDRILTAAEKAAMRAALVTRFLNSPNVVHQGDSLTLGRQATAIPAFTGINENAPQGFGTDYPSRLRAKLGWTYPLQNYGIGGQAIGVANGSTPSMLSQSAAIDALVSSTRRKNILCLWGGINDCSPLGRTGAQIRADQVSRVLSAQAAGWYPIIGTIAAAAIAAGPEAQRLDANSRMRVNAEGLTCPLVDIAADPRFQNILDTAYYDPDQTHYTDLGYDVLASLWLPYVLAA